MAWINENSPVSYEKYEQLRDAAKMTDNAVATECGFSKTLLSEWKSGKRNVGIKTLLSLSKFFNVPIEAFIDEK